jgi:arabinogalactan endo-1,4-beta-galactosidase
MWNDPVDSSIAEDGQGNMKITEAININQKNKIFLMRYLLQDQIYAVLWLS